MPYDYGYGDLENKLIDLFRAGAPDFAAAEELIRQGADLNAIGNDEDENMLSEIITGYQDTEYGYEDDRCDNCEKETCKGCEYNRNPNAGQSLCAIIRFFLDHGFEVNTNDGVFGAQCLSALIFSVYDRYMIEATKILLDAGAKNRVPSLNATGYDETVQEMIASECSYADCCERDHALANIYEAIYQVYEAHKEGRPYHGIDSYEAAVGKKIMKVLAKSDAGKPVFFPMDLAEFKHNNCFNASLYFVYDGGVLITTQYADFWTDTELCENETVDVSECFEGMIGNAIQSVVFDHRDVVKGTTFHGQPITIIEMDSGRKFKFSINFGEVNPEERAAYYEMIC